MSKEVKINWFLLILAITIACVFALLVGQKIRDNVVQEDRGLQCAYGTIYYDEIEKEIVQYECK